MAFNVISNITLDMKHAYSVSNIVQVNQYDTAGVIKAQLLNDGAKWLVPQDAKPVVMFKKTDNIGGFYDVTDTDPEIAAVSIDTDRSIIYISLDPQTTTTATSNGKYVDMQVAFFENGLRISTFAFYMQVLPSVITSGDLLPDKNKQFTSSWIFNILSKEIADTLTVATTPDAMTEWLEANITQETGYVIDNTLTVAGAASDAQATGKMVTVSNLNPNTVANKVWVKKTPAEIQIPTCEEVDELKSTLGHKLLADYPQKAGTLGASGTWANVNTSVYKHMVVPAKPYDIVTITTNSLSYTRIGFVKTYTVPSANTDTVDYSSQTGFTARIAINANTKAEYEVPSDVNYIIIDSLENGADSIPASCVINDIDLAKSLFDTVSNVQSEMSNKADWDDLGIKPIDSYDRHNGLINSSGAWGTLTSAYQHVIIPVKSGDKINIESNESVSTYIAFLKNYILPVTNVSAYFSEQTGFTSRIPIQSQSSVSFTVPSDANYIYCLVVNNNENVMPKVLAVNSYNIIDSLCDNLAKMQSEIDNNKYLLFKPNTFPVSWESGVFTSNIGSRSNNQAEVKRQRSIGYYRNEIETILHTDGTFTTNLVLYTDNLIVESKTEYDKSNKVIPANKYYRILIADGVSSATDISGYTSDQINTHISISNNDFYDLINPNVKWCAMGDSITEGFVSYMNDDTPTYKIDKDLAWAYKIAKKNNWNLTNLGIGGTGWNKPTNTQETQGTDTTSAHYIAKHTDYTPFNLVTLAYGINDWKSNNANIPIGSISDSYNPSSVPVTVVDGMRQTLDAIIASNPHCKIIIILPLNCAGYQFNYGDVSTNWAIGYNTTNHGTLEEFVQVMIEVCDYYGIQYIDMTHYSCINRYNLLSCLTDGVHPNAEAHDLLARELSRKITFN